MVAPTNDSLKSAGRSPAAGRDKARPSRDCAPRARDSFSERAGLCPGPLGQSKHHAAHGAAARAAKAGACARFVAASENMNTTAPAATATPTAAHANRTFPPLMTSLLTISTITRRLSPFTFRLTHTLPNTSWPPSPHHRPSRRRRRYGRPSESLPCWRRRPPSDHASRGGSHFSRLDQSRQHW